MNTLLLRAALKRGLILASANWPVVLIDFAVGSFHKMALTLPVIGGALMVFTLVGTDLQTVLAQGMMSTADVVLGSLATAPVALSAFLAGLMIVAVGGEAMTFTVKAGTLAVLVQADRQAGEVQRLPIGVDSVVPARAFEAERVVEGARHFARRMVTLALCLGMTYVVATVGYVVVVSYGVTRDGRGAWIPAWSLVVLLSTSAGIVFVAGVNLVCDLLRVVIVTDDCRVQTAVRRVCVFVMEDARQVIGIFSVIGGIEIAAASAALLAAAGLTPVAYVPFVSLVIVPLQAVVWMLRGLVLEGVTVASLSAYQTQYRRFSEARWPAPSAAGTRSA